LVGALRDLVMRHGRRGTVHGENSGSILPTKTSGGRGDGFSEKSRPVAAPPLHHPTVFPLFCASSHVSSGWK
jgi:hypothetical protein